MERVCTSEDRPRRTNMCTARIVAGAIVALIFPVLAAASQDDTIGSSLDHGTPEPIVLDTDFNIQENVSAARAKGTAQTERSRHLRRLLTGAWQPSGFFSSLGWLAWGFLSSFVGTGMSAVCFLGGYDGVVCDVGNGLALSGVGIVLLSASPGVDAGSPPRRSGGVGLRVAW